MTMIALEEHWADDELLQIAGFDPSRLPAKSREGLANARARLSDMDAAGIDVQIVSPIPSGAQNLPGDRAARTARRLNHRLHDDMVARWPERFGAFATLPLSDPVAASAELEHCVTQLGFSGAMIYGMPDGSFLDHPTHADLLDTAARLDVPLYLHPATPPNSVVENYYSGLPSDIGHALATHAYGWHYETSLHALRMIVAGVFDRLPRLQIILGHLGEGLPFHAERIDRMIGNRPTGPTRQVAYYLRENFWATTSGYFDDGPFQLTRSTFGDHRMMFSVDYPFSDGQSATTWFDDLALPSSTRELIGHANAARLVRARAGAA